MPPRAITTEDKLDMPLSELLEPDPDMEVDEPKHENEPKREKSKRDGGGKGWVVQQASYPDLPHALPFPGQQTDHER